MRLQQSIRGRSCTVIDGNRFLRPYVDRNTNLSRGRRVQEGIEVHYPGSANEHDNRALRHLVEKGTVDLAGILCGGCCQQEDNRRTAKAFIERDRCNTCFE